MNMLKVAPKLTEEDWKHIVFCVRRASEWKKEVTKHELLLWNKEIVLEAVHRWAMWGITTQYLLHERKVLKKLGWDGVRRDGK